jgi:hypothetical protein
MCVMLYSTAPSAAEESAQSDFPHSLLGFMHLRARNVMSPSAENMERAIVRASNEAIVRHDGDGEKVGIGREGGERIPGFEVPELDRLCHAHFDKTIIKNEWTPLLKDLNSAVAVRNSIATGKQTSFSKLVFWSLGSRQ